VDSSADFEELGLGLWMNDGDGPLLLVAALFFFHFRYRENCPP
jgi:hypothetical protein